MNRPIIFRCWGKLEKCFIEWFEMSMNGEVFFGTDDQTDKQPQYILQQFTGFLDKKGKMIYEGDIVKESFNMPDEEDSIWTVKWDIKLGGFMDEDEPLGDMVKNLEIIGNIFNDSKN